jgi:hypothetical protein
MYTSWHLERKDFRKEFKECMLKWLKQNHKEENNWEESYLFNEQLFCAWKRAATKDPSYLFNGYIYHKDSTALQQEQLWEKMMRKWCRYHSRKKDAWEGRQFYNKELFSEWHEKNAEMVRGNYPSSLKGWQYTPWVNRGILHEEWQARMRSWSKAAWVTRMHGSDAANSASMSST